MGLEFRICLGLREFGCRVWGFKGFWGLGGLGFRAERFKGLGAQG